MPRRSLAHGARSAAATELRRSRCCDGVAAASLRRSCADQLRRAHSARRVRDGADVAATELMLRAALLRRSCDGVAATTELRRSRCCDGAATESLLRRSCADQLRRAHSARRVSTRRAERGASIISPHDDLNFNGRGPQS